MVSVADSSCFYNQGLTKYNSGCDLKSHLYSFSFNLNPNWSKELCQQPEILQCKYPEIFILLIASTKCRQTWKTLWTNSTSESMYNLPSNVSVPSGAVTSLNGKS